MTKSHPKYSSSAELDELTLLRDDGERMLGALDTVLSHRDQIDEVAYKELLNLHEKLARIAIVKKRGYRVRSVIALLSSLVAAAFVAIFAAFIYDGVRIFDFNMAIDWAKLTLILLPSLSIVVGVAMAVIFVNVFVSKTRAVGRTRSTWR